MYLFTLKYEKTKILLDIWYFFARIKFCQEESLGVRKMEKLSSLSIDKAYWLCYTYIVINNVLYYELKGTNGQTIRKGGTQSFQSLNPQVFLAQWLSATETRLCNTKPILLG
jgi:hypothetical protein